jgi:hypothetical protein
MVQDSPNTGPVSNHTQATPDQPSDPQGASSVSAGFSWHARRRMLWLTTIFCMLAISYVLYTGMTGSVAETVVTMSFFTIVSMVGSYVFGAAWQDIAAIRTIGK